MQLIDIQSLYFGYLFLKTKFRSLIFWLPLSEEKIKVARMSFTAISLIYDNYSATKGSTISIVDKLVLC